MLRRFCVRERTKNPVPFVSGCPTHPVSIRLSTPEPFWGELIKPPARTPPQQMNHTLVCAHKHTQTYGQRASVGNRSEEKYSTHVDSTGYVPVVIHVHYTTYSHSPRSVTVLLLAGNCLQRCEDTERILLSPNNFRPASPTHFPFWTYRRAQLRRVLKCQTTSKAERRKISNQFQAFSSPFSCATEFSVFFLESRRTAFSYHLRITFGVISRSHPDPPAHSNEHVIAPGRGLSLLIRQYDRLP